jgi:hypothetical protein
MLGGYPIYYPEYMQQVGNTGDILLINPTRYVWAAKDSPRQLPTDHVHAVPTREYQSDQSSR